MMNLVHSLLIFLLLTSQAAYASQSYRIWTALSVGNKRSSSHDIHAYIEATRLGANTKQQLFKASDKDWQRYNELLRSFYQEHFEGALKELAYAQLLEHKATRVTAAQKSRKAFTTTERDFMEAVQDRESEALREYLDQRLGIVKAREYFGRDLIEQGHPHKPSETATDVYWNWYEDQKQIIKEDFRKTEVQKYEYLMATKTNRNLHIRPTELFDLKQDLDTKIETQLHGQYLSADEVKDIMQETPALQYRIKAVHALSLAKSPLSRIYGLDKDSKFEDSLRLIEQRFISKLDSKLSGRIASYKSIAQKLKEKYQNPKRLTELSESKINEFVEGGTYNDFMLARLYSIASELDEKEESKVDLMVSKLEKRLTKAFSQLSKDLIRLETYTDKDNQSLLFEDVVAKRLHSLLNTEELEGLEREFYDMAIWVVKFEAKKLALQDQSKIFVEKTNFDSFEGQKTLNNFLKREAFKKGLKNYQKNELRRSEYLLSLNPDGRTYLSSQAAYNYIMGLEQSW